MLPLFRAGLSNGHYGQNIAMSLVKWKQCACWQTLFTVTPATNVWLTFKMKKRHICFNNLSGVSSRVSGSQIYLLMQSTRVRIQSLPSYIIYCTPPGMGNWRYTARNVFQYGLLDHVRFRWSIIKHSKSHSHKDCFQFMMLILSPTRRGR